MAKLATGGAPGESRRVTRDEAAAMVPTAAGRRDVAVFAQGTLVVEYYAPAGVDRQTPHARDELYVVLSGTGWFVNGGERHPFAPGDVLFVPAGTVHRFEDFTEDFATWVMFYGPDGGEREGG